jgi:hypothetical protein
MQRESSRSNLAFERSRERLQMNKTPVKSPELTPNKPKESIIETQKSVKISVYGDVARENNQTVKFPITEKFIPNSR